MEVKLPENRVIDVKLDEDGHGLSRPSQYNGDINDWIAYLRALRDKGYLSFAVDYEHSYYDSVEIVFKAMRRETDEEVAQREAKEESERKRREAYELAEYKKLKAKFGSV